jgi:hypothetical protein
MEKKFWKKKAGYIPRSNTPIMIGSFIVMIIFIGTTMQPILASSMISKESETNPDEECLSCQSNSEYEKNIINKNDPLPTPIPGVWLEITKKLGGFGVFFLIKNIGTDNSGYVDWRITFEKGHVIIPYSWCRIGTIKNIPGSTSRIIGTIAFGFNLFKPAIIHIQAEDQNGLSTIDVYYKCVIIGFYTRIVESL